MKTLLISFSLVLGMSVSTPILPAASAERPVPSYAKWGRMAMQQTKQRYKNAQIIDYLHIGRVDNPASSTEKFKLWLREGSREFGVFIDIEFDRKTEAVKNITFRETDR